jgi:hypothetical protein
MDDNDRQELLHILQHWQMQTLMAKFDNQIGKIHLSCLSATNPPTYSLSALSRLKLRTVPVSPLPLTTMNHTPLTCNVLHDHHWNP